MRKAVAIPYIIALILGIVVVALVGYWLYRTYWGAPLGEQQCRARMISWCNSCKTANGMSMDSWTEEGIKVGDDLAECSGLHYGTGWTENQNCKTASNALGTCKGFIE
jgi:hypothetical protein